MALMQWGRALQARPSLHRPQGAKINFGACRPFGPQLASIYARNPYMPS
jgi:hypothetical protein